MGRAAIQTYFRIFYNPFAPIAIYRSTASTRIYVVGVICIIS